MTILIAGGGIAGLTAALSLHQIGVPCRVFETVASPRPLGVGINVLPHAVRELTELGLQPVLAEAGIATAELAYYSKFGQRIWTEPRGRDAGYNWPQYSIHRGLLQQMLLEAARERLGTHNILHRLSPRWLERNHDRRHRPFHRQTFRLGLAGRAGDLLIGADGIHSVVRATLIRRRPAAVERRDPLARHHASRPVPDRAQHDHGRPRVPEVRRLPDRPSGGGAGRGGDQLDRRTQIPPRPRLAAGGLEPCRPPVRLPAPVRRLAVRLAGCAGGDPGGQCAASNSPWWTGTRWTAGRSAASR